jgi:hypothetical protein
MQRIFGVKCPPIKTRLDGIAVSMPVDVGPREG